MNQLPLALHLPPRLGPEDFLVVPCNAAAHAAVEAWPAWPDRVLLLHGAAGSGKTHLAHLWARRSGARFVAPDDLTGDVSPLANRPVIVDGADRPDFAELGLFHLLNLVRDKGSWLLLTARRPPDLWPIAIADLRSRLRLAPAIAIEAPDDALLRAVLVKTFDDRQLAIDAALIDYLMRRIDRSLGAVRFVAEALDAASLGAGRRITKALAAEVLHDLAAQDD